MFNIDNLNDINVWQYLKNTDKPIILYGMGNGADKVFKVFQRFNIKCSGIMASDDFVRGQQYRGFTVNNLNYFENKYSNFIIAVTFGTQIPEVIDNIQNLSKTHNVIVPNVPVFGDKIFDDDFIFKNKEKIVTAYSLLGDNQSRKVYEYAIKFYYSGNLQYLFEITENKDEIFKNILKLSKYENYIDLGAYRGDTIQELINYAGGYKSIKAIEPDFKTYNKLCKYIKNMDNVTAYHKAVWKKNDTTLIFSNSGGRNSTISKKGVPIKTITIDSLSQNKDISYIKMDVEGAEKEALAGGLTTLQNLKPKLNIAVYHRFEDIFDIILLIYTINPDYKFYLRHHPYIPLWDTNLYCI